jgi:hypothetical protein
LPHIAKTGFGGEKETKITQKSFLFAKKERELQEERASVCA